MYSPDPDSPFGEAVAEFQQKGADALRPYSTDSLDEFASCARFELSKPVNEGDELLTRFANACTTLLVLRHVY